MTQANTDNSTTSRRRFLTVAAAASAVSAGALTAAAMPEHQACTASQDDSGLIELEGLIFEQHERAAAFDDEIVRLSAIWTAESNRLYQGELAAEIRSGIYLSPQERWKLVTDIPECIEHNRLCNLQEPFLAKKDALIKQMLSTPAHTAEGRRAKVIVLLGCVMGDDWRNADEATDYPERAARSLLIEFIGGEPGEAMRDLA